MVCTRRDGFVDRNAKRNIFKIILNNKIESLYMGLTLKSPMMASEINYLKNIYNFSLLKINRLPLNLATLH